MTTLSFANMELQEVLTPEEVISVLEHYADNMLPIQGRFVNEQFQRAYRGTKPNAQELERIVKALELGKEKACVSDKLDWMGVGRLLIREGWLPDV